MEPLFRVIAERAAALDTRALVVGGYVRDRLLGGDRAAAIHEVDVLVERAKGLELARSVAEAMRAHAPVVFERFGTAHLEVPPYAIEFVSTRKEQYDPRSRKPQVTPGTLEEDVRRRDFTVNALLMDWDGTVLDLTGRGLEDLRERRIRTPLEPEATFDEDPLRMLRAVRFATVLDFELDPAVRAAIVAHAPRLQPPVVSMERIRDEFVKLLLDRGAERGLLMMAETRLLKQVVPALEAGRGMQQGGWHSHDVFGHNLLAAALTAPDLVTRLAGLLHDVGKPATCEVKDGKPTFINHQEVGARMAAEALRRLRFPGETVDRVANLVRLHMRPIQYDPATWADQAVRRLVREAGEDIDRLLDLARADMRASHYPSVEKIDHLEQRIRVLDAAATRAIRSPLSGEELMAKTGRSPGPWIKRVKTALEEAMVDGALTADKAAAWAYLDAHPELLDE